MFHDSTLYMITDNSLQLPAVQVCTSNAASELLVLSSDKEDKNRCIATAIQYNTHF